MELLRKLHHPHILELFGSYRQNGIQNFLFPCADQDLHRFFRSQNSLTADDIYLSLYRLADALAHIHRYTYQDGEVQLERIGYHHDLRPANILQFGNKFVIADFGLSKLKPQNETSKSRLRGGQDDYLSPEAFNESNWTNGNVGRALDVWAFGCILAEFATYIEGESVEDFRMAREEKYGDTNFSITDHAFHLCGKMRQAVDDWLNKLVAGSKNQLMTDLVALVREMLNSAWRQRITMDLVAQKLAVISFRSKSTSIISMFPTFSHSPSSNSAEVSGQPSAFLSLERELFVAWTEEFEKLIQTVNPNIMHDQINQTLETLTILQERLRQFESKSQSLGPSNESGIPAPIQEVCSLIDSLQSRLSSDQQRSMERSWTEMVTEIDDMRILQTIRLAATPARYRSVGVKAAMKYMAGAITKARRSAQLQWTIEPGLVDVDPDYPKSAMQRFNSNALRNMGSCYDRRVLIEWTRYNLEWKGKIGEEMYARLEAQAKFLSSEETPRVNPLKERVLECLGYFHHENYYRFGFVYAIPTTKLVLNENETQFYTLYNYIEDSRPPRSDEPRGKLQRPYLGDLFTLAKGLAASLHTLHEIGWLHKGICSENILIFTAGKANAYRHVSSAVLAGFYQSRPEEAEYSGRPTRGFELYEHPLYRHQPHKSVKVPFKRSFDFFSLGIVLLEIGLWCSVWQILSDHISPQKDNRRIGTEEDSEDSQDDEENDPTSLDAEDYRQILLKSYVPQLGETMGEEYMHAVRFCLDAEAVLGQHGTDIEGRKLAGREFKTQVLNHLAVCSA
jgi:serine/threonine protein kinase